MASELELTAFIENRLESVEIFSETQSTSNIELNSALKTASKNQSGNIGRPDHIATVSDFVLVMEDKNDRTKLILREDGQISQSVKAIKDYAINGALFYAYKILDGTHYKKIFAFGNAGDRKHHIIQPIFVDADKNITELPPVDTFKNFTAENIENYYRRMVLGEESAEEIELRKVIGYSKNLHEYLRSYGALGETEKPRVVSAVLLALSEKKFGFDVSQLIGDKIKTDGAKIFEQVENNLRRTNVRDEKKEKVLDQFRLIKNRPQLNNVNQLLGKTPLKFFAEYIEKNIYDAVVNNSAEDYLGRFYGEFISYSGGDGQSLGIVLTPRHITELFCDLVDLKPDDVVLDPCCGTGGFLISAMNHMIKKAADDYQQKNIKQNQLHGIDNREDMFSIATTNMILRGDGKSNLICGDFFAQEANKLQLKGFTVGLMNPPYAQAKDKATEHLLEINFVLHLLDSVTRGGRVAVIVPVSVMIGKKNKEKLIKQDILSRHTLEGVITLNKNTFYGVGTVPCIAIFTAGEPHNPNHRVKFINFEDDGFEVKKHVGLVETERAKDKKSYLLDCWRGKITDAPSKFMVETTIEPQDEWLHSFYYYNDELPADNDFFNSVADFLTFEFNMIAHGRDYLFQNKKKQPLITDIPPLNDKTWKKFLIKDIFSTIRNGKQVYTGSYVKKDDLKPGITPRITVTANNNGVFDFYTSEDKNYKVQENFISVSFLGDCFYHPYKASLDMKVHCLKLLSRELDNHVALFLIKTIKQMTSVFNYGDQLSSTDIVNKNIFLPINNAGEPDFEYMAAYIGNIEAKILEKYREFVEIAPPLVIIQPLSAKKWRAFYIKDIFEVIQRGKRLKTADHIAGNVPYISSSAQNNGVDAFIGNNSDIRAFEDCLTLANSGSVGKSFYHSYKFIASDHVTALSSSKLNKYHYLFMSAQLDKLNEKYSFNREINDVRIRREKLMLPINDAGELDFEYMERYMRLQEAEILRRVLEKLI